MQVQQYSQVIHAVLQGCQQCIAVLDAAVGEVVTHLSCDTTFM